MVRYGSVSVGVAVEQETSFHSSDANHPLLNSSGTSLLYNNPPPPSNLSSPPNVTSTTTHHQSLRITFAYQAGSGAMSDVIITLSDRDQQQLIRKGTLTSLERGALMAQRTNSKSPLPPTTFGNEMEVYTIETADKFNSDNNNNASKDGGVTFGKIYIEEIPNSPKKETKLKAICDSDDNNNVCEKKQDEKKDKENQDSAISTDKGKETKKEESIERENCNKNKDEVQEGSPKKEKRSSEEKEIKENDEKAGEENKDCKKTKDKDGTTKGKVKKGKEKTRESSVNASLGKIEGFEGARSGTGTGNSADDNKNNNKSKKAKKNKNGKQVTFSPARDRRARSMSKSRIPIINSVAHEYYPCEYYRQKLMCDHGVCDYHTCWMNFPAMQKSAGQKVVKKITAQQKKLEDAAKKKVEFVLDDEEYPDKPLQALIPTKKRPTRLEPILVRRNK